METSVDSLNILNNISFTPSPLLESGDLLTLLKGLGAIILIGLLIGLEREHSRSKDHKIFAGIRTFPLIGILGFLAALISSLLGPWIYAAIFIGFSGLILMAYISSTREGRLGGTSEITAFLVFILGTLVYWGYFLIPAIIAIIITMFLSLKIQFHTFVGKVSSDDIFATLKFAVLTIIILPLLPDRTFGPLDVLNPRLVWYMVIFISGISFIGYILIKLLGKDRGITLTGLLGGMVSSTAVAFAMSKKSVESPMHSQNFAVGILLASTMMFLRVIIIVMVINLELVSSLWIPLLVFSVVGYTVSRVVHKKASKDNIPDIKIANPFELKSAFLFAIIFAVVIFGAKAAQVYLGSGGLILASAFAGFSSVDAIVLSLSKLSTENLTIAVAEKAIIIALISNTIVKIMISVIWGSKELKVTILKGLGIIIIIPALYLLSLYIL